MIDNAVLEFKLHDRHIDDFHVLPDRFLRDLLDWWKHLHTYVMRYHVASSFQPRKAVEARQTHQGMTSVPYGMFGANCCLRHNSLLLCYVMFAADLTSI